jgi:hypothetical protein
MVSFAVNIVKIMDFDFTVIFSTTAIWREALFLDDLLD